MSDLPFESCVNNQCFALPYNSIQLRTWLHVIDLETQVPKSVTSSVADRGIVSAAWRTCVLALSLGATSNVNQVGEQLNSFPYGNVWATKPLTITKQLERAEWSEL